MQNRLRDPRDIIIVMSDQHSRQAVGFYGNRDVMTPNLDRLADSSCVFTNAYCPAPICGPSRFSFMTGQDVHHCGSWDNGSSLRYDEPTLGHLMTSAGYRSVLCGRMHLHGPDQHAGFEERPVTGWINPVHAPPSGLRAPGTPFPEFGGMSNGANHDPYAVDELPLIHIDDDVVENACRIICEKREQDQRPLFMIVGLYGPHPSVRGRKEYRELIETYLGMNLTVNEFTEEQWQQQHPFVKGHAMTEGKGRLPDREYNRRQLAEYYARITYTDRLIGRVFTALQKEERFDDALVVYTSDHGETMGKKGMWGKVNFLENAVGVPLSIKLPGQQEKRTLAENVSLTDIFATLADTQEVTLPYSVAGRSLKPVLEKKAMPGPNEVLSQYHGTYSDHSMFMLKKDNYKYNYYVGRRPELYDLATDPHEENDLAVSASAALLTEMQNRLLKRLGEKPESVECRARENQSKRQMIADAVKASPIVKKRLCQRIDAWRAGRDEPWWDEHGAAYMNGGQPQLQD